MSKIFTLIFIILIISSCGPSRRCTCSGMQDKEIVERIVTRELRDTVIEYILPDSTVTNSVVHTDTSHLETQAAMSDAWVDRKGNLNHTLSNKLEPIPVVVQSPLVTVKEVHNLTRTVTKEVERELTKWQRFRLGLCNSLLILLGFSAVSFIVKKMRIFGI